MQIFADRCSNEDELKTDIGICFQINLNGGGKFYNYGSQINVASSTDKEIKAAIRLALEKGWLGLDFTGNYEFKSQFFEAV